MAFEFIFESMVRGYHVYKHVWDANIGETLPCEVESGNASDPHAVAVKEGSTIVGHVPRAISAVSGRFRSQNWHIFDGPFCARNGTLCTSGSFSTVSLYGDWSAHFAISGSFSTVSLYRDWSAHFAISGSFSTAHFAISGSFSTANFALVDNFNKPFLVESEVHHFWIVLFKCMLCH